MSVTKKHVTVVLNQNGFTLVEMIIVIVLTAIIGAAVAVFIRSPVQGYVDMVARADLTDEADTAVRRISRDLRLALPNSVRITTSGSSTYLELLLTKTGGRYLDEENDVNDPGTHILDFGDSSKKSFTVVGVLAAGSQQIQIQAAGHGDYVVVYNLGEDPANAYCNGDSCGNRAKISSVNGQTITLAANPFAQQLPVILRSPSHRFQVVSTPVTYACDPVAGTLTRFSAYTIQSVQPTAPAGAVAGVLANGITACAFAYNTLANVRSALVGITLSMQRPDTHSGTITLFHQVHVDNTP